VILALWGDVQDAVMGATLTTGGDLEHLYRAHGDRLWRSLLAFAGDPDVASDAVAEAFAQALRRGAEIRDAERWIWRSAFKIAAGELKERRRFAPPSTDARYELEEPARELVSALRQLSEKQRLSVVLHHAAGYPVREVAEILESTPAAVRVHLSRGRRRLRELLKEEEP
jgi:RNA polymerase sigma-70 factor, ECF subfamily